MKRQAFVVAIMLALGLPLASAQATGPCAPPVGPRNGEIHAPDVKTPGAPAPATAPDVAQPPANGPNVQTRVGMHVARVGLVNGGGWAQQQERQRLMQKQMIEQMPQAGTCRQDELVRMLLVNGCLDVDPGSFTFTPGQNRIKVEGSPATWLVNTNLSGPNAEFHGGPDYFTVTRYDWEKDDNDPEGIWMTSLTLSHGIMINAQGMGVTVNFAQRGEGVTLSVSEMQNGQVRENLTAPTLIQMEAENPKVVRKYLDPVLLRLAGRQLLKPGPFDVYSVFTEIQPDPAVSRRVAEIIVRLDAEDFPTREKASAELTKLGTPGILAAMRVDMEHLTVEQKVRLNEFIGTARRFALTDPVAARKDLNFLLQAMDDADPAVVTAAQKALDALVGRSVQVDQQKDATKHSQAIVALQASLLKELQIKGIIKAPAAAKETRAAPQ